MAGRTVEVDGRRCDGCGACVDSCPEGAISLSAEVAYIAPALCNACLACVGQCPRQAIRVTEMVNLPQTRPAVQPPVRTGGLPSVVASAGAIALAYLAERVLPRLVQGIFNGALKSAGGSQEAGPEPTVGSINTTTGAAGGGRRNRRHGRRS